MTPLGVLFGLTVFISEKARRTHVKYDGLFRSFLFSLMINGRQSESVRKRKRRFNDDLKRQLNDLKKEFQRLSCLRWRNRRIFTKRQLPLYRTHSMSNSSAAATMLLLSQNRACQKLWKIFLVGWIYRTLTELIKLSTRCSTNVSWISWAFHLYQKEDLHKIPRNCVWSYFPALESISLCQRSTLPMHRVPQPDTWTGNGHRRQLNPIVCKFTRRMIRDTVLASRGNASRLTTDDLDLPFTAEINRIAIYSHLTLRLQELLHSAKAHQNTYNHKWCWAKGASIFLRKTDPSTTIRLGLIDDLTKLTLRQLPLQKRVYLFVEGRGSRVPCRGRGYHVEGRG